MAINKHYDTFGLRKLGMFSNDDFYHLSLLEPDIYQIIGDGKMPSRLPHFEVTESDHTLLESFNLKVISILHKAT